MKEEGYRSGEQEDEGSLPAVPACALMAEKKACTDTGGKANTTTSIGEAQFHACKKSI